MFTEVGIGNINWYAFCGEFHRSRCESRSGRYYLLQQPTLSLYKSAYGRHIPLRAIPGSVVALVIHSNHRRHNRVSWQHYVLWGTLVSRPQSSVAALMAGAALFLGCGCASSDKSSSGSFERAFSVGLEARRAAHSVVERELHACMDGQGFTYFPREFIDVKLLDEPANLLVMTEDRAGSVAYALAASYDLSLQFVRENQPNVAYVESLEPSAQAKYDAAHTQCSDKAVVVAEKEVPNVIQTDEMLHQLETQVEKYRQVARDLGGLIFAVWSQCMEERGFSFPTPLDAQSALENQMNNAGDDFDIEKFRTTERETALADAQCQARQRDSFANLAADVLTQVQGND